MPRMRTTLLLAFALVACGDSGTTTTTDAPAEVPLTCATYCNELSTNCTGANAQYPSTAQCTATCGKMSLTGKVTDTTGNTLGCRIYHAGAPSAMTPATHCVHAGPGGAQVGAAAQCGDTCTSFCTLNLATCTGALAQYTDMTTCMTACAGFANNTALYTVDASVTPPKTPKGDSLACRLYHTTNAAIDAASATTHCPHSAATPASGTPCFGPAS
jgi:hypothetical protein